VLGLYNKRSEVNIIKETMKHQKMEIEKDDEMEQQNKKEEYNERVSNS
jgi:hypothetical protein